MSNSNIPLEVREFNNKNDRKPVMLLPVRLETRFVKVKHVYRPEPNEGSPFYDDKTELWVRIYPDDISITTHEDGLSAPEIEAGKTYWQTYFEANGDSNLHLGAWRQLCVAHGPQRAAYVARQTQPTQFNPQDSTFSGPPVIDMQADKDGAWTQAPQTFAMPDRFVIILHRRNTAHDLQRSFHVCEPILGPLQVGPDPLGEDGFKDDVIEGELDFPDGMKWMADFEEAERVGMALRIRFGPEDSQKIENLVALGLNLQDSAADALEKVKELFENHRYTNGLSIIPQGTPTNNTAESGAGYQEDALGIDAMFEAERGALRYQDTEDPLLRKDGQWLADALGLDREQIGHLPHSDGTDIAETLNMNTALWPTTLRFYLENMMYPSLDEDTLNQTGAFFSRYVSGRGHIPAIRIGDQPYGILATSNFKAWSYSDLQHEFHQGMIIFFLKGMHSAWSNLVNNIPSLATGNVTEADEELLSVIGLHASSIEFHQRFLAGEDFLENLKSAANVGDTAVQGPENGSSQTQLTDGGHVFPAISSILNTFSINEDRILKGPLVDDVPVSELEPVQVLEGKSSNYLSWLIGANYEALKAEDYSELAPANSENPDRPRAMLYLMLRHALLLEYANASYGLLKGANSNFDLAIGKEQISAFPSGYTLSTAEEGELRTVIRANFEERIQLQTEVYEVQHNPSAADKTAYTAGLNASLQADVDAEFDRQIAFLADSSEPWYNVNQVPTHIPDWPLDLKIWEYLEANLEPPIADRINLAAIKGAIGNLANASSAGLERAFTEHLDLVSYRLDAWIGGLYQERLDTYREGQSPGLYLGAYGYLETLQANGDYGVEVLELVLKDATDTNPWVPGSYDFVPHPQFNADSEWEYIGGSRDKSGLEWDIRTKYLLPEAVERADSQGFVHTASLNQAIAAAVLRAGYKADENLPEALAVNLNSERIRTALFYMEGVRNGQELGALLGYKLERSFREKYPDGELVAHLGALRQAYPLVAESKTVVNSGVSVEQVEATNVADGLKLLEDLRNNAPAQNWASRFNFGAEEAKVIEEVELLANEMDAVSDLSLAEAIFQMTQGRNERADAVMQALNGEQPFPEIEFVRTPRSSNTLKQRVCLHLNSAASNSDFWFPRSSRAYAEPHLNTFLGFQMPKPKNICFNTFLEMDDETGNPHSLRQKIKLDELGMQPIDFFMLLSRQMDDPTNSELSQHIAYVARTKYFDRDEGQIRINFSDRTGFGAQQTTLMACMAQLEALVDVVRQSRPLGHTDLIRAGELTQGAGQWDLDELGSRLNHAINGGGRPYTLKTLGNHIFNALKNIRRKRSTLQNIKLLRQRLMDCTKLAIENAMPETVVATEGLTLENLLLQGDRVLADLQALKLVAEARKAEGDAAEGEARKRAYMEAFQLIFGKEFIVLPRFQQDDPGSFAQAKSYAQASNGLLDGAGDFVMEEWWQSTACVRPAMQDLMRLSLLNEAFFASPRLPSLLPMQFPHDPNGHWVGTEYPKAWKPPGDALSLVNLFPPLHDPAAPQVGLVIDEWTEAIPGELSNTGIAMHHNQPDAKAPQSILYCISPQLSTGNWNYHGLIEIILETFAMAKIRAVDPDLVKSSGYSQMLPATYAVHHGDSDFPYLDYGRNIGKGFRGVFGSSMKFLVDLSYQTIFDFQNNNN